MVKNKEVTENQRLLRQIPAVEHLLQTPDVSALFSQVERSVVSQCAGDVLKEVRASLISGEGRKAWLLEEGGATRLNEAALLDAIARKVDQAVSCSMRRVVNATGVIIHTNLGRSVLPKEAVEAVAIAASGYSNLEYDVEQGARSKRWKHLAGTLASLSGAEDALVVNNNAAAVLVGLNTLAQGKEVIVSRGELVEIGGSFRMPDVMAASGAILREVGSTNKTKLTDYESAITDNTALILKVHTSNYKIVGFSQDVSGKELSALSKRYNLPMMVDLGSGLVVGKGTLPLPDGLELDEPVVRDVVTDGADIVTFSADKLLGASQAGVIVGRRELVQTIAKNPLSRAIRIDKLSLAALDATLRLYVRWPTRVHEFIPTLSMITTPHSVIKVRAQKIRRRIRSVLDDSLRVDIEPGASKVGGGSLPLLELPTMLVTVSSQRVSAEAIERALRGAPVPVIARIAENKVLLDPRTVLDDDIDALISAFRMVVQEIRNHE